LRFSFDIHVHNPVRETGRAVRTSLNGDDVQSAGRRIYLSEIQVQLVHCGRVNSAAAATATRAGGSIVVESLLSMTRDACRSSRGRLALVAEKEDIFKLIRAVRFANESEVFYCEIVF